jgi:hypothetical protein
VGFEAPERLTLKAHHITSLELQGNSNQVNSMDQLDVYYQVNNMKVSSNEDLVVTFSFRNN